MCRGRLDIAGPWGKGDKIRYVSARPELLRSFLSLGDASDDQIRNFAARYGTLEVFLEYSSPFGEFSEYCEVWRYLARAMLALLKIAASLQGERPVAEENWVVIAKTPRNIPINNSRERHWLLRTSYIGKCIGVAADARIGALDGPVRSSSDLADQIRAHIGLHLDLKVVRYIERALNGGLLYRELRKFRVPVPADFSSHRSGMGSATKQKKNVELVLNDLIELAYVRPWMTWAREATRPRIVYTGNTLFSNLVLQLCLRMATVEALVLCTHCQKEYRPHQRAPKTTQRNFCPECRDKGVPHRYANKDSRDRKRKELNGEKTR